MADTVPVVETPPDSDRLTKLEKSFADIGSKLDELAKPNYPAGFTPALFGGKAPHGTVGPVGEDSRPYSILRVVAAAKGLIPRERAKYEFHVSEELRKSYTGEVGSTTGANSLLLPYGTDFLPCDTDTEARLQTELRQKFMQDSQTVVDPDEYSWVRSKALSTQIDTAGGPLVGFPALGELVDMQRNLEAFSNAGASQVPLGPNGQMYYPKLISGATAYWMGENPPAGVTTSQQTTGSLNLQAKTLAIRVPVSNQLLKFNLISAESMIRQDMARIGALKADSAQFDGTGGTQIKGLLTYDTQSTWSQGTDKLIGVTATTAASDGNTLNSKDLYIMNGALPDMVSDNLSWLFRKDYWWKYLATARAGGSTTGDGQYLLSQMRSIDAGIPNQRFLGSKLVLSSQSPNTRKKGNGSNLVCVILGYFPDWLIGRAGVVEVDVNPYGDTPWQNIQTELRLVQYIDAGPRHAASFAVCDTLLPTAFTA